MTLADFLVALAARIAAIDNRLTELSTMQGMTPEQSAALAQATTDVAALRTDVDALRTQGAEMRAEIDMLKVEVAALKGGLGDLSALPTI